MIFHLPDSFERPSLLVPSGISACVAAVTFLLSASPVFCQALHAKPGAVAGYRIAGTVVSAETGVPIPGAEVSIAAVPDGPRSMEDEPEPPAPRRFRGRSGPGRPPAQTALQAVTTGNDGGFAFDELPAGKYALTAAHRGYLEANYQQHGIYSTAIVVGNGTEAESNHLRFEISAGAVISGTVTDSGGDAIEESALTLYRLNDDGLGSIRTFGSANTDDQGSYEFAHLPAGVYYLSSDSRGAWYSSGPTGEEDDTLRATPEPATNLDLIYPRTFFPDTTDSHSASALAVRGGERVRADLHVLAVPAVHLRVPVPAPQADAEGGSNEIAGVSLPPAFDDRDGPSRASGNVAMQMTREHGRQVASFSVAPGEYRVETSSGSVAVNALGDTLIEPHAGTPSVSTTGKLAPDRNGSLPSSLNVILDPQDGRGRLLFTQVLRDGSFTFEQVRPGRYDLRVQSQGRPMAITRLATGGTEAAPTDAATSETSARVVRIGNQPVTLAALIARADTVVSGFAHDDSGRPRSGIMIVLVPSDPEDRSSYRRDQSDSDGSFSLRGVAPGRYTVVAIENGWDLDWAKSSVIAGYLRRGEALTVTDGDGKLVHLPHPVTVQAK